MPMNALVFVVQILLSLVPVAFGDVTFTGSDLSHAFGSVSERPSYAAAAQEFMQMGVKKSPWLTVIGTLQVSEKTASELIAKFIYDEFGYRTVMLANWNQIDTPGFDGILVDQDGQPVA